MAAFHPVRPERVSSQHSSRVPYSTVLGWLVSHSVPVLGGFSQNSRRPMVFWERLCLCVVGSSNKSCGYVLRTAGNVHCTFPRRMGCWWKRFRSDNPASRVFIWWSRGALLPLIGPVVYAAPFLLHSKDCPPHLWRLVNVDVIPRRPFRITAAVNNGRRVTIMSVGIGYVQEVAIVKLCTCQ
jgi:hypothetical protein